MEQNRPSISRGETEILKAIWKIEKGSVGEIYSAVSSQLSIDYSTVQTYVRRLEAKGYLTSKRVGRNKIYRSAIGKAQVFSEAIDEILERLFDGQLLPMVKLVVDNRTVSPEEIEDLMQIVLKLQRGQEQEDA